MEEFNETFQEATKEAQAKAQTLMQGAVDVGGPETDISEIRSAAQAKSVITRKQNQFKKMMEEQLEGMMAEQFPVGDKALGIIYRFFPFLEGFIEDNPLLQGWALQTAQQVLPLALKRMPALANRIPKELLQVLSGANPAVPNPNPGPQRPRAIPTGYGPDTSEDYYERVRAQARQDALQEVTQKKREKVVL